MLQQVLENIHNYFARPEGVTRGTFTISGGTVSPTPALKDGQRFLIAGSDLNDGIYTWHASIRGIGNDDDTGSADLADEVFSGAVYGLSVPPQVVALSMEIGEYVTKYGDALASPYTSESFGGYSYTRASASKADGSSGAAGWEDVFRTRMDRWRKVSFGC